MYINLQRSVGRLGGVIYAHSFFIEKETDLLYDTVINN